MNDGVSKAGFRLCEGLTPEQEAAVLALGRSVRVQAGDPIVRLGDKANVLALVVSGKVNLTLPLTIQGEEKDVFLEEKSAGDAVGWSALVPPYRFTLNGHASIDCEFMTFKREDLEVLFRKDPDLGLVFVNNLAVLIGQRLLKLQAMWVREIQRTITGRFKGDGI